MTEFLSVYMTAASREEAEKISLALVEESLVSCANIFPGVLSIYKWEGKTERANECAIIAKITAERFDALKARVKALHSYECPCIVAMPITAGDERFLEWVEKG